MAKRRSPSKRRPVEGADAFTKPNTSKNAFAPLDVQAAGRRSNDKVMQKPRKGIIEDSSGGLA